LEFLIFIGGGATVELRYADIDPDDRDSDLIDPLVPYLRVSRYVKSSTPCPSLLPSILCGASKDNSYIDATSTLIANRGNIQQAPGKTDTGSA
jgi:hypothetical protein